MKKEQPTTILGTIFRCMACGTRFAAGTLGIEPLTKRVMQHAFEHGHLGIPAINPLRGCATRTWPAPSS